MGLGPSGSLPHCYYCFLLLIFWQCVCVCVLYSKCFTGRHRVESCYVQRIELLALLHNQYENAVLCSQVFSAEQTN